MGRKEVQFAAVSRLIYTSVSLYLAYRVYTQWISSQGNEPITGVKEVLGVMMAVFLAWMFQSISNSKPSDHYTFLTIISLWCLRSVMRFITTIWFERKFLAAVNDPRRTQAEWLTRFIKDREKTAFGRDHDFASIRSVEDFRRKMPISDYEAYREYMERAARGEKDVLFPGKAFYIILTSGTTGNNKKFPFMKSSFWAHLFTFLILQMHLTRRKFPGRHHFRKSFMCWVPPNIEMSEGGIRMGAFSGCFKVHQGMTSPPVVFHEVKDEKMAMYIHALFGLLHKDVENLNINFVSLARSFFLTLETHWQSIVEDIKTGTLSRNLELAPEVRQEVEKHIYANPTRAEELRAEFEKGFDNIVPRIWPEVECVYMLASGTLLTPSLTLRKKYFPNVPISSGWHGASEGNYGVCLDPGDPEKTYYTMFPHVSFYEFIPLEEIESEQPATKLMHELDIGQQYEICVTTDRGICRFRTGDIIKVASYYEKTPQYELIGRYGQILNVCGEKTSENTFNVALEDTVTKLSDFSMIDYSTAENRYLDTLFAAEDARYYILFIELEPKKTANASLTEEQKNMFDEDLQVYNENYKQLRQEGRIEQMKVIEVQPSAFSALKLHILSFNKKTSSAQFKTPRVLKTEEHLRFILEKAIRPMDNYFTVNK